MTVPASRRLSALVVNYKSGAFALACVESLKREWCRTRVGLDLEIVVVDNASPGDPAPELRELARRGVRVVQNPQNIGFAGGIQRALRETQGGPRDVVCVLNPDVVFLPGSIDPVMDYLEEHDACGVCGPRAVLDPTERLMLPRIELPTPLTELGTSLGRISRRAARALARRRTKRTRAFWESSVPLRTAMISGACMFIRRETIHRVGCLMDPGYPLYYEDSDLCARVRAAGLETRLVPESRIVHHWARSSGAGDEAPDWPQHWWATSRQRYLDTHYGRPARWSVQLAERLCSLWPDARKDRPIHDLEDLGALHSPPWISLPVSTRFVLEIAMAPTFPLAAGLYGAGDGWTIEPGAWEWLFGGRYFARAIDCSGGELDGEVLGAWTFQKTTHARVEPYSSSEFESELEQLLPEAEVFEQAPPLLDDVAAALPEAPAAPTTLATPYAAPVFEPPAPMTTHTPFQPPESPPPSGGGPALPDWFQADDEAPPGWDQGRLP